MAKSDVLVRMKADTTGYDPNIAKARRTLQGFIDDNLTAGGAIKQLTGSLVASATQFASVTAAVTAMGAAIKETMSESIALAKSGEGVRAAFERLNRPDLLDNLKEATHGTVSEIELMKQAVKFDNFKLSLDDMGAMLAFAQQKAKDTGESIDYMVNSITTGLGRQSKQILDNLGISAAELTRRMNEGATMTQAVADIVREEMAKAGDYVETAADRAAQAAAKATDKMEDLGRKAMPIADEWAKAWNEISAGGMELLTTVLGPIADSMRSIRELLEGDFEIKFKADIPNLGDGPISSPTKQPGRDHVVQAPGGYVEVTDKNTGEVIGGKHFENLDDKNAIKDWKKTLYKTPKTSTKKQDLPEYADFNKQLFNSMNGESLKSEIEHLSVFDMFKDQAKFDPENILGSKDAWEDYKDTIAGAIGDIGDSMDNLTTWTKDYDPYKEKMDELSKTAKQNMIAMNLAGQAVGSFSQALSGMEDPGAKAAGMVVGALASIAFGFAQAAAAKDTVGSGWAWLVWMVAGLSAMATAIGTVHNLTGYAEGGIVGGNSYSGDNVYAGNAWVNSGELILNKAQQNSIADQLTGNGGPIRVIGKIRGSDIILSADRALQESGRGQLLTWG